MIAVLPRSLGVLGLVLFDEVSGLQLLGVMVIGFERYSYLFSGPGVNVLGVNHGYVDVTEAESRNQRIGKGMGAEE